ncbi:MAG: HAD-IA family hydrolase [Acidimicrobiales bacterium]
MSVDADPTGIGIVLFDLGGVLLDVGGVNPMRALAGIDDDEELWRRWLTSPWVRRFERGQCSADAFAAGLVDEWELGLPPDAFLEALGSWQNTTMPGAEALLDEVRRHVPIGCLSNINALHWDAQCAGSAMFEAFTYRFLSFELGMVKPDDELFEHIGARLPVPRRRVLFLDDNATNVRAASSAGFTAAHVRGVEEARAALVSAGVLDR